MLDLDDSAATHRCNRFRVITNAAQNFVRVLTEFGHSANLQLAAPELKTWPRQSQRLLRSRQFAFQEELSFAPMRVLEDLCELANVGDGYVSRSKLRLDFLSIDHRDQLRKGSEQGFVIANALFVSCETRILQQPLTVEHAAKRFDLMLMIRTDRDMPVERSICFRGCDEPIA